MHSLNSAILILSPLINLSNDIKKKKSPLFKKLIKRKFWTNKKELMLGSKSSTKIKVILILFLSYLITNSKDNNVFFRNLNLNEQPLSETDFFIELLKKE